jgi:hypothetical protein
MINSVMAAKVAFETTLARSGFNISSRQGEAGHIKARKVEVIRPLRTLISPTKIEIAE